MLPQLALFNLRDSGVENLPLLGGLSAKIRSLELRIVGHAILHPDCLPYCPRTISEVMKGSHDTAYASGPDETAFQVALIQNFGRFLHRSQQNIETLCLDIASFQWNRFLPGWFTLVLREANKLSPTPISFLNLKRVLIENSWIEGKLLKHLLATLPFITHLSIFGMGKAEFDVIVRKQPMLKRL